MIERTYMGIDGRRDHSFRVPRPDLAAETGSPDACTDCHTDRGPEWAAARIAEWYPESEQRGPHFGQTLVRQQGFHADIVLDAPPGDHVVQLVAVQERGTDVVWEGPLTLEGRSDTGFLLRSSDLDELETLMNADEYDQFLDRGEE